MRVVGLTCDQFHKKWEEVQEKIITFASIDSKKTVRDLSVQYSPKKDNTKG